MDIVENEHGRREEHDRGLRGEDAWQHRHVEAAGHDVAGKRENPQCHNGGKIAGEPLIDERERPVGGIGPDVHRQQLRPNALDRTEIVHAEGSAELECGQDRRLRHLSVDPIIVRPQDRGAEQGLGGHQGDHSDADKNPFAEHELWMQPRRVDIHVTGLTEKVRSRQHCHRIPARTLFLYDTFEGTIRPKR